jgi:hypothetical protein
VAADEARDAHLIKQLKDSDLNSRTAMLSVAIGFEQLADRNLAIADLSEAVDQVLRTAKLGHCDGDGFGGGMVEIAAEIRPRRYPEAVEAIRTCLEGFGIHEMTFSGIQLR